MKRHKNERHLAYFIAAAIILMLCACAEDPPSIDVDPSAVVTNISDGATNVDVATIVTVEFLKTLDVSTVSNTSLFLQPTVLANLSELLPQDASPAGLCDPENAIAANVSCATDLDCIIAPEGPLSYSTSYALCITPGIIYSDGNAYPGKIISFTTGAAPGTPPILTFTRDPFTFVKDTPSTTEEPCNSGGPFTACGGITPELPAGLALDSATCEISGIPIETSSSTVYTLTVEYPGGTTTAEVTMQVNDISPIIRVDGSPFTQVELVEIDDITPTLNDSVVSVSVSPALPSGLTLNTTTGVISGRPTENIPATEYTLTASNSTGQTATDVISITVDGMALWLKADAVTGLNDGDLISLWEDQSGNDYDAATSSQELNICNSPVYRTQMLNGLPAISFNIEDGHAQDCLTRASGIGTDSETTSFIVLKSPVFGSNVGIFSLRAVGENNVDWDSCDGIAFTDTPEANGYTTLMGCDYRDSNPGGSGGSTSQRDITANEFYIITLQRSNSELRGWLGDTEFDSEYDPYVCLTSQLSVGGYVISARGSGEDNYHGERTIGYGQNIIAEIIVYGSALTESQRSSVAAYLKNKYDL